MARSQIRHTTEGLEVITPYDGHFLTALKRLVPASERRWRKPAWIIHPRHESAIRDMVHVHFGRFELIVNHDNEQSGGLVQVQQVQRVEVSYVGACRQRDGDSESSAFGWADGDWSIIFPESVLRVFFKAGPASGINNSTLYTILGIDQDAVGEIVKSAYRRAARQWHPDVNKEPEAAGMFRRISEAYQVLSDTRQRARYDAGLALENTNGAALVMTSLAMAYRAPFTCGLIQFRGHRSLGRWIVEEIISWDDITDDQGRIMVSSWNKLTNAFQIAWLDDYEVEL